MDSSMEQYLAERKSRIYHARGQKYLQMYTEGRSVLAKLRPTPHELQIEERPFNFYRHGLQIPYTWSLKQNVRLHLSRYVYYLNKSSRTELMETLDGLEIMNEAALSTLYYPDGTIAFDESATEENSFLQEVDLLIATTH